MMNGFVDYRPQIKKYAQGYKIADINKQAEKDGLIYIYKVSEEVSKNLYYQNPDLYDNIYGGYPEVKDDDLFEALDEKEITIYKPFNTDETCQWFIKKYDIPKVLDWFGCEE